MSVTFAQQHHGLVKIAREIVDSVLRITAASIQDFTSLRLELARAIQKHVHDEIALIRQLDRSDRGSDQKALISKYHDDLLAWRMLLAECNAKWPTASVMADPKGFLSDFQPIQRALAQRVKWEEEIFYPQVLSRELLGRAAT